MSQYIIGVKFDDNSYSKEYDFKYECAVIDIGIRDKVVVNSKNGLAIATVHSVIRLAVGETYPKATAWVIQKIDMTAFNAREQREKKQTEIKNKLESRRKQLEEGMMYEILAQGDPIMAGLLADYRRVSNG